MNNLDGNLMDFMFSNSYKLYKSEIEDKDRSPIQIQDDLTEEEAIALSNELLEVLIKHNLSYKNSYRVCLALTAALGIGGVELYKNENNIDF